MSSSIRGAHVSPGIYTAENEVNYSVKSIGNTTLGLVGETLRGAAFEVIDVENWRDYQSKFGGTSTEKFKDTQYPKYELPYIAKSYLSESNQLKVCRVLGLSGYNAGPAWVITLKGNGYYEKSALAVLRSRGFYEPYYKAKGDGAAAEPCGCGTNVKYDYQRFYTGEFVDSECLKNDDGEVDQYTTRNFDLDSVKLGIYKPINSSGDECSKYLLGQNTQCNTDECVSCCAADNYGKFNIRIVLSPDFHDSSKDITTEPDEEDKDLYIEMKDSTGGTVYKYCDYIYSVSLNPTDKDYILKVLGTNNDDGSAPIYVESLYDVALEQGIITGDIDGVYSKLETFTPTLMSDYCKIAPVYDIMTKQQNSLTSKDRGKRFLASHYSREQSIVCASGGSLNQYATSGTTTLYDQEVTYQEDDIMVKEVICGLVYEVKQFTTKDGKRKYLYVETTDFLDNLSEYTLESGESGKTKMEGCRFYYTNDKLGDVLIDETEVDLYKGHHSGVVYVQKDNIYCRRVTIKTDEGDYDDIVPVTVDLNNYKKRYSCATTPWIVSNVKGDHNNIEVNRLFKFNTISDGNSSNYEIKVSIENIRPDEEDGAGTFDVIIRNINDTDESIQPLEKFTRCNMIPGTSNYIGKKIGTTDGDYERVSQYVTVQIYDKGVVQQNSVPCGFLGYPTGFNGYHTKNDEDETVWVGGYSVVGQNTVAPPVLLYNTNYDEDIKARKQYFGLSSITGVDIDAFTYKGINAYIESQEYLTNGFHLDCRLDPSSYANKIGPNITVDGEEGFRFDTTSINARTSILEDSPIIGSEEEMYDCIFSDVKLRKFTLYFYGGFDGWDVYRKSRTNTDDFKLTKYKGNYSNITGEGYSFDKITDPEIIGLNQKGITSDWYAYLSGYRQFANVEDADINIFATPGIDLINNKLLAEEVISMIEEERGDSIYVATLPDKPSGASDYVDEMYTADDIVDELDNTEIDSSYTCTYYPWVKYYDGENNQYIYLPVTRDVVRNMAQTDNQSYCWFPPAGIDRGDVQGVRAHIVTKLAEEDALYEGRINPVKSFAQEGLKIWGQKNLQKDEDSQRNRIAVRRLLLRMKKLISRASLPLIFTPNDARAKESLQGIITPIMDNIKSNRGITDYRIEITSSDATLEDRRELHCRILVKPLTILEYISFEFTVTPENVSFDDL